MRVHNIKKEKWKPILGYEKFYEVSSYGRIRSMDRIILCSNGETRNYKGKILKFSFDKRGYKIVKLCKNGVGTSYSVHRLVALAFIQNPDNKKTVNHINENKKDNRVENLEWMTNLENICYGTRTERQKQKLSKSVVGTNLITGKEEEFPSMKEASLKTGCNNGLISQCCKGLVTKTKNYKWRLKK